MRQISSSSWYIFIIDKFDDNFNSFDKDSYAILEKDYYLGYKIILA